jgi:hypothetical protein
VASTIERTRRRSTRSGRRRGRRESQQRPTSALERHLIEGLAVVAGVAGAFAGCEPTGGSIADPVLSGLLAAAVTLAASRARRWSWIYIAGLAAVGSNTGATSLVAAVALIAAVVGAFVPRRRIYGAVVGALAVQALLRLPDLGFHGASAMLAAAAVIPVLVSGYALSPRSTRRVAQRCLIGLGAVAALGLVVFLVAAMVAWGGVNAGVDRARDGLDA